MVKNIKINWQAIALSALNSVAFFIFFYAFVAFTTLQFSESLTLMGILLLLHLPILLAIHFKWRYLMIVTMIGWVMIWGGSLMYSSQIENTMRDLAVISWVLFSWAISTGVGIIVQTLITTIKTVRKGQ